MGNNDNRVVTHSELNSFITANGGSPKNSNASSYAIPFGEFNQYAPMYTGTTAGVVISDYTGIGGGAYTSNQLVIEKDVTWKVADRVPTTAISISGPDQVSVGSTIALTATLTPENATDPVMWSIDDDSIATIDQNGVVTGVTEGTVIVTATSNGISATHNVNVTRVYSPASTARVDVVAWAATVFINDNPVVNPGANGSSFPAEGRSVEGAFTYNTGTQKTFYFCPADGYEYNYVRARYFSSTGTEIGHFNCTVTNAGTWNGLDCYSLSYTLNPLVDGAYTITIEIYTSSTGGGGEDLDEDTFSNSVVGSLETFDVFGTYDYDTTANGSYDAETEFGATSGTITAFRKKIASFTISCSSEEEAQGIEAAGYEYTWSTQHDNDWDQTPSSDWLSVSTEVSGSNVTVYYNGLDDNVDGGDKWAYLRVIAADGTWEAYTVHQTDDYGVGSYSGSSSGTSFSVSCSPTYAWSASWSDSDKIDWERNYGGSAEVGYSETVDHPTVTFSSTMGKSDTSYTF